MSESEAVLKDLINIAESAEELSHRERALDGILDVLVKGNGYICSADIELLLKSRSGSLKVLGRFFDKKRRSVEKMFPPPKVVAK